MTIPTEHANVLPMSEETNGSVYKEKGDIVTIGTFDADGQPTNWHFANAKIGIEMNAELEIIRWGGYSINELREIASSRCD